MSTLLEVRRRASQLPRPAVLQGVSFEVGEGELVGLIGPNGAGKSTLFNVISGFLVPDAGTVRYARQDVSRRSVPQRSQAGLMRTFQTPAGLPAPERAREPDDRLVQTDRQRCPRRPARHARARRDVARMQEAADAACARFALGAVRDRVAGKLPAGQQRLVELARAAVSQPRLLCLDEPSSGLNSEEVGQLMALLRELNQAGTSLLLVSHDMDLVTVATRIHVLCFGEIIASGPLDRIQADARVRDAYLGV